ncbi:hypothetical protein ACHAW6_001735, partial [Cyclotella cf. meneghiniana]
QCLIDFQRLRQLSGPLIADTTIFQIYCLQCLIDFQSLRQLSGPLAANRIPTTNLLSAMSC